MELKKKGVYFTLDAFFASLLLLMGVILITKFTFSEVNTQQIDFLSKDLLNSFGELKISELNNSWVKDQINKSAIVNTDNTVIEQIGIYWSQNLTDAAQNLSIILIESLIPSRYGANITIEGQTVYSTSSTPPTNLVSSRRLLTGIQQDSPISGASSTAILRKIRNKKTAAFFYFGGFVGQGNITGILYSLPESLNGTEVIDVTMEADLVSDFEFYLNNVYCGLYNTTAQKLKAERWNLSSCSSYINSSINNTFRIEFTSNVSNSHISGGYIKVVYNSSDFNEKEKPGLKRYYTPGIDGVVNLFDSFFVPGDLNNLSVYLHYIANSLTLNNTFYMTIGDQLVYRDNISNGTMEIYLDNRNFTALNYTALNSTTVPVRIGFENLSFQEVIVGTGEGFGDIVLTTDVSGSMNWEFDSTSTGTLRYCDDPQLYDNSTRRISVAKCLDRDFVTDVFENTTLNRISLVSYESAVDSVLALTNNVNDLYTEIDNYNSGGGTCISCGAAEARAQLTNPPPVKLNNDFWKFTMNYQFSNPPASWNSNSYNDSSWEEGEASFGYNGTEQTTISSPNSTANLWENAGDDAGPPADFNSGNLNSTVNTFGNLTVQDGWDWTEGNVYNGDNTNVNDQGLVDTGSSDYEFRMDIGGSPTSTGTYETSAGAYGILVNITPSMYSLMQSGGFATLSFRWSWDDRGWFETGDQVWIKARITNTTGSSFYLGSDLDSGHTAGDAENEIYADDDPDGDAWNQLASIDISQYITEPGLYYIDFGGKLHRDTGFEPGRFYFDDVQIGVTTAIGNAYFRTSFSITDTSRFSNLRLFVSSDDGAEVYLNGNLVSNDSGPHASSYWNVNQSLAIGNLIDGDNVLAVKLLNNDTIRGFFDLELTANMTDRQRALVIMSDGDANDCVGSWTTTDGGCNDCGGEPCCPDGNGVFTSACPDLPGVGDASDQLINISCYLYNHEGISIYTVAFGDVSQAGQDTLNMSASCQNASHFYTSNNVSGLSGLYQDIAQSIVESFTTRVSQIILTSGQTFTDSTLFDDSYIEVNYTPIVPPIQTNEISVVFQDDNLNLNQTLNNCTTTVNIQSGLRVIDSEVTAYSADHWANLVMVDNTVVFNLTEYSPTYILLGDPFVIQVPSNLLTAGNHSLTIQTGDDPFNFTGCSQNNSLVYKAAINSSTPRSNVVEYNVGCVWTIEFEDNSNSTFPEPADYVGNNTCAYTNASISYDPADAYQIAVFELLEQLDFDNDGRVIFNFGLEDLEVIVNVVSNIPYLWGPSIVEVRMWQ